MTYHLGKAKLKEVAVANASDVCPDGKDGLPALVSCWISGYVTNGRSLSSANFKEVVMSAEVSRVAPMYYPLFLSV